MDARLNAHRLAVTLQSTALLASLAALVALAALALAGPAAALWGLFGAAALAWASTRAAPYRLLLRQLRAVPVGPRDAAWLRDAVALLASRAGLARPPRVYVLPSPALNALAMGDRGDPAVAVTAGLLRALGPRELLGVLAHEVAHIRHGDLAWTQAASALATVARVLGQAGALLALITLPLALAGAPALAWDALLLLALAPVASTLLQLALSRARELRADVAAVELTGDALGLASALARLERHGDGSWMRRLGWGRPRVEVPEALRTHPATADRVARLRAIAGLAAPQRPAARPAAHRLYPTRKGQPEYGSRHRAML